MEKRFNPEHMAKLDNPERRKALPPETILKLLDVQENDVILDAGAGTGYFTISAAELTQNKVFALDIEPQMLQFLQSKLEGEGLHNVELVQGPIERIPLNDAIVNHVIASFVIHEVEPLESGLQEISRVLKSGGKVLCVEWEKKETEQGPPLHHRLHSAELSRAFEQNGFSIEELSFPTEQHYIIMAKKIQ